MTASQSDGHFTPCGLDYAAPGSPSYSDQPLRLSFEPFRQPPDGDPDGDAPGYRIIDGYATHRVKRLFQDGRVVFFRGIDGTEYVLADGDFFRPDNDLPEWAKDDLSLSDHDLVLGRKAADGNGFVAIGVNVVLLYPE
jgi:hypothetical protein